LVYSSTECNVLEASGGCTLHIDPGGCLDVGRIGGFLSLTSACLLSASIEFWAEVYEAVGAVCRGRGGGIHTAISTNVQLDRHSADRKSAGSRNAVALSSLDNI